MIAQARRRRGPASADAEHDEEPLRLLLDTQVWLWWQSGDPRLGVRARSAIMRASEVRFSAASAWEIAIKVGLGKLTLPRACDIEAELEQDGFQTLAIELAHANAVRALPTIHRDPFDRMLVAQAQAEALSIVTADPVIGQYQASVVHAGE